MRTVTRSRRTPRCWRRSRPPTRVRWRRPGRCGAPPSTSRPMRTSSSPVTATSGLRTDAIAPELVDVLEACEPSAGETWEPATSVPPEAVDVIGLWHWGNSPKVLTWDGSVLRMADAGTGERPEVFRLVAGE